MKVAINRCFGGFCVNQEVYAKLGIKWDGYGFLDNEALGIESDNYLAWRSDKRLIMAIEKIGEDAAGGSHSALRIVEIPDDVDWEVDEYDGMESIHEKHRIWI